MDATATRQCLEQLRFTAELPPAVLDRLAPSAAIEQFPAGAVLFREGALHEALYLLQAGRVALEMRVPGRGSVRILSLGPGDVVGWSALLSEGPMTATAVALEPCTVVAIPGAALRSLCDADHAIGYRLMRHMAQALSRRLVATRLQLLDLFGDTCSADEPCDGVAP